MAPRIEQKSHLKSANIETDPDVLAVLHAQFTLSVIWTFTNDRPVHIYYVKLNTRPLIKSTVEPDSPCTAQVPADLVGKSAKLAWYLSPLVDLQALELVLADGAGRHRTLAKAPKDSLKRAATWGGSVNVVLKLK